MKQSVPRRLALVVGFMLSDVTCFANFSPPPLDFEAPPDYPAELSLGFDWSDDTPDLLYTNIDRLGRVHTKIFGGVTNDYSFDLEGKITAVTNRGPAGQKGRIFTIDICSLMLSAE